MRLMLIATARSERPSAGMENSARAATMTPATPAAKRANWLMLMTVIATAIHRKSWMRLQAVGWNPTADARPFQPK